MTFSAPIGNHALSAQALTLAASTSTRTPLAAAPGTASTSLSSLAQLTSSASQLARIAGRFVSPIALLALSVTGCGGATQTVFEAEIAEAQAHPLYFLYEAAVDNGDLVTSERERRVAGRVLLARTDPSASAACERVITPTRERLEALREEMQVAFRFLRAEGYELVSSEQVYYHDDVEAIRPMDLRDFCDWSSYYRMQFIRNDQVYNIVTPALLNVEMGGPRMTVFHLLRALGAATPGTHVNGPAFGTPPGELNSRFQEIMGR